jgi:glutathione S-transferase
VLNVITVYGDPVSGNCYKLALILALTRRQHHWIDIDVVKGEARSADFLLKNPNGRVPLVVLEDGTFLAESNTCLFFFADHSDYWPADSRSQAQVLQWMFFEQ